MSSPRPLLPAAHCRVAFVALGTHEYQRRLARGVSRFASPRNGCVVREFILPAGARELPAALGGWGPQATVSFVAPEETELFGALRRLDVPMVSVSRTEPGPRLAVVLGDAEEVYSSIHAHFASLGITNIWQYSLGEPRSPASSVERYRQYCEANDLECQAFWGPNVPKLQNIAQMEEVEPSVADWLTGLRKPVGIFSQQNYAGQYLCHMCRLLGLRVPEEVALVGTDGFDIATASDPPVTSLRIPAEEVGYKAARLAVAMHHGEPTPQGIVPVRGMSLIARRSTVASDPVTGCDIDAALAFIAAHACEGIKVHDVVSHTQSVSRATFHKQFREQVGATPAELIEGTRLSEARRLLAETEMSAGAIAGMCGYLDYIHFYRVFRKAEGVSPTEYRRLIR